ncbi:MAG: leucine-rich repeat protein [Ruminococcus sp.]|nr:leucine-rich repeat protein [Ruminococcus sp.]
MKRQFSKRLSTAAVTTVFTVTSVIAVMPPPVHAADDEESWLYTDEGFAYIVNGDGNITIKGFDEEKELPTDRIVLPSTIDGKYVTEIDSSAFGHGVYSSNSTVTEIVLPDHIEKINNWCFNDYKALDTLVIPKTLKKAERPFTYCKINKVIIEDGMEKIPDWLFSSTDYMGEIVIPDSVTAIGDNAFEAITGLKEIHVPDSVKSIGRCAISDNPDLEVLDLPDVLDFVGSYAFEENPKLTSVTVPDTWTFSEDTEGGFFQRCGIKEITFGDRITEIPANICYSCENLETINWSSAPTKIGSRAFQYCKSLTDPKIPDSVELIESYAFADCTGITHLDLPTGLKDLGRQSFDSTTSLKELYVPVQLPYPGDYGRSSAFSNSGIEKLTYAEGITEIHGRFAYLPELTEVVLPSTLQYIHGYAFEECPKLAHIDIPEGVTEVTGINVFGGCDSITELVLPSTLEKSNWSLSSAPHLQKVTFADGLKAIPYRCLIGCKELTQIVIPDSVTEIGESAFESTPITSIDLPSGVTKIGWDAFSKTKLTYLYIPASVTEAEQIARNTDELRIVRIGDSMKTVPKKLLYNCPSVEKVILPSSVELIEAEAFAECPELIEIEAPQEAIPFKASAFDYSDNMWDQRFSFAEQNGLYMSSTASSTADGALINYSIHYSINPCFRDVFREGSIYVDSNYRDNFVEESYGESAVRDYGKLRFDFTEPEGTLRFSVRSDAKSELTVSAWMKVKMHPDEQYGTDCKNIVVDGTDMSPLTLTAPETVNVSDGKSSFSVSGTGPLDSDITVRVNGKDSVSVKSNKYTGRYSAFVTYEGTATELSIDAVCGELTSAKKAVLLCENYPELVSVKINHIKETDLTPAFRTGKKPYVAINPRYDMTFDVEVSDNSNIAKLYVTSEKGGEFSSLPLELDETTGKWTGTGKFATSLPGKLSITQIPKQEKEMIYKTVKDGTVSYKVKDSENELSPTANNTANPNDPAKVFLDNVRTSTAIATENNTLVRYDYTPTETFKKDNPDISEVSIGVFQSITDSVGIGGKKVTANAISSAPEDYGFVESGLKMTDENGDVHSYFVKVLAETADAVEVAKSLTIPDDVSSAYDTAMDFLGAKPFDYVSGMVMVDRNESTGEVKAETQLVSNQEAKTSFMDEHGEFIGGQTVSADIAIVQDSLSDVAQNGLNVVGGVFTVFNAGCEMVVHGEAYSMQRSQIDYSKDPYVQAHKAELKAEAENIFFGRMVTTTGAAAASIVVGFAGLTLWPALIAGAVIGIGAYCIQNYYNRRAKKLDAIIYRDPRKKIGNSADPNFIADPSGYVYAAVPDNRVEGATATIYYKDEAGKEVLWNAEDFDQLNPQTTASDGWFMWDVPEGMWQVRISKEGYKDAASEWLPVLPVQTGINIDLMSTAAPKIQMLDAFANGVEIKMSQYIDDSTAAAENIYLTDANGEKINCRIKLVKSETNDTKFSDRILLISDQENIAGSTLHITAGLLSYSGVAAEPVSEKITEVKDELLVDGDTDSTLGDVNEDGKIDAKDASMILVTYSKASTGADDGLTAAQKAASDVNGDGRIDAKDASCVLAYYAMVSTATGDIPTISEYLASKAA